MHAGSETKSLNPLSYDEERQEKTLFMGRFFSILAVVSAPAFALWDTITFGTRAFIFWGLVGLLPALVFILASFTFLRRRGPLVIPLHILVQLGVMVMACGYTYTTYLMTQGSSHPGGSSPAVVVTALFFILIFASGARPLFALVSLPPLFAVTIALLLHGGVPTVAVAHLSSAWVLAVAGIAAGLAQERVFREEYRMRALAQERKLELEKEIAEVRRLNERLEREIVDRKAVEAELERRAAMDELTDVFNRRAGMEILTQSLYLAQRNKQTLSVCFVDVDELKMVNDNYGHAAGDRLLQHVINILKKHLRKSDHVSRIGGDEFLIVLPNCTRESAEYIIGRIGEDLRSTEESTLPATVSISTGVAEYAGDREVHPQELLKEADENMYRSKQAKKHPHGRGR